MPIQQGIIGNITNPTLEAEVNLKLDDTEADIKTPLLNLKANANSKSASPIKDCANGEMTTEEDALITTEETM